MLWRRKITCSRNYFVAVAFAHSQKNDADIGINMFGRALEKIGDFRGLYHNIDVDRIQKKNY